MILNPLPIHTSRFGGCTLTGALSVTTHIRNTASIVHGPKGCTHHNFSLLHATGLDNETVTLPALVSTALSESDIVFGGEGALLRTLEAVAENDVEAIFVLSSCIVDTIGDDVAAICNREYGVPVVIVPTAGFLGGTFQNGVANALCAIAGTAEPCPVSDSVNIIGEKNLEYEVEENYAEVIRLLDMLGIPVNIRYVHDITFDEIGFLGAARLNVLREPALMPVGNYLNERFGTPFIPSFPLGLSGTISFVEAVAGTFGIDSSRVVEKERLFQRDTLDGFSDLEGMAASFDPAMIDPEGVNSSSEVAEAVRMHMKKPGTSGVSLGPGTPVGTTGVRRMLHRWRRQLHA
ncbi:MAG: nitrogenase component 1 [Methanoregula sp.]|nr:nitrogenase component 1 [Methanoregula sp.]